MTQFYTFKNPIKALVLIFCFVLSVSASAQTNFAVLGGPDSGGIGFQTMANNTSLVVSNVMENDVTEMFTSTPSQFTIKAYGVDDFTFEGMNLRGLQATLVDITSTVTFKDKSGVTIQVMSLNIEKTLTTSSVSLTAFFDSGTTIPINNVAEIIFDLKKPSTFETQNYNYIDITISASVANIIPDISIDNTTLSYTENDAATQIDAAGTVNDADGDTDWDGGTLQVQITANTEAADEISLPDNIVGNINTSGTDIRNGATVIGILSASEGTVTGSTALTISFNSNATNTLVQEVLRAIHYRNTSDDPGTSNRTVTFTATDKNSGSVNDTRIVSFTAINDEPTLTATGTNPTFTEDASAAVVFSSTSASTVESGQTLSAFTITVTNVNDGSNEHLNLDDSTIVLTHGTSGTTAVNSLSYSVSVVGTTATVTFTGGTVSTTAFQTLINAISYQNNSNTPNTSNRVVAIIELTDSGESTGSHDNLNDILSVESTVTVVAFNDDPQISSLVSDVTVTEDVASNVDFSAATLSDVDAASGSIQLALSASAGVLTASSGGSVTIIVSGTGMLSLTGTVSDIDTYLNTASNIQYTGASNVNGNDAASLSLTANDGGNTGTGGGTNVALGTVNVDITAVNDEPTLTATFLNPTFTEDASAAVVFGSASASTVESGQSLTGFQISLTNVNDGSSEILNVDGTAITLTNGTSGATASFSYSVSVDGSFTATITLTGGTVSTTAFQTLINAISYQNNSNTPNTSNRVVTITNLIDSGSNTGDNDNTAALAIASTVTVNANNDAPTLTSFADVVESTTQNTEIEITLAELKAQGDEADVDGPVDAFIVNALSSGTLNIGPNSGSATSFNISTNKTIDATNNAYWTPASNASGVLNAFTTTVLDNTGAESTGAVQATVTVNDVTAPLLVSTSPLDNATNVNLSDNIILNFDDDMVAGTGNVTIKKISDNTVFEQIAIGDARITILSTQVTINPLQILARGLAYYIEIDATALDDDSSNSFAGISGNSTLNFTAVDVVINEVVTDPQQDWSSTNFSSAPGGSAGSNDEWLELYINSTGLDLTGWTIELLDGSDITGDLTNTGAFAVSNYVGSGSFANTTTGDYLLLGNPVSDGLLNNSITINLKDPGGAIVDAVVLGGGAGEAPDGGATSIYDESVQRYINGLDTDVDSDDFTLGMASMGSANTGPSVTLSVSSAIAEASGVSTITATLSSATSQNVTVTLAVDGSSTAVPADYTLSSSSIVITAGSTTGTATITATQDLKDENNETVIVNITGVTNGTENGTQQQTVTISDDDAAPTVAFNATSSNGSETLGSADLQVDLSAASGLDVTVDYTVTGTASGADYTLADGMLTITAGTVNKNITIASIVNDLLDENNETVILTLSSPTNASLGTNTVHTYTINDNDATPTLAFNATSSNGSETLGSADLQVDLSAASGLTVTVDYTVTGTATSADYTLADGTLTITAGDVNDNITIASIVNDLLDENNETVIVTLSSPTNAILGTNTVHTYTINDNDATPTVAFNASSSNGSETLGSADLQVDLSATSGLPVSVDYTITGTASDADYSLADGTLAIAAGDANDNISIVGIVNDFLDESNETVILTLSNPINATLGTNTVHTYTINDDDVTGFTITESDGNTQVLESGTNDSFTIQLDVLPASDVVIDLVNANTSEISMSPSSLTFTAGNWSVPQTVNLITVDDDYDDGDQSVDITMSINDAASDDAFDALTNQILSVTSVDDETVGFTLSKLTASVSEDGSTDNINVTLDARPHSDVVLTVTSSDETESTLLPTTLTFTSDNWSTGQMITVSGQDDAVVDGNLVSTITVSVDDAGSADAFDALADQTVSCTTTDDEVADFTIVETAGYTYVRENGSTDNFTVKLSGEPVGDVVLSISSSDTGEASIDKATLTFTSANWNTYQTVTVTGVDDVLTDGEQTPAITIAVVDASSHDAFDSVLDKQVNVINADNDSPGFTISQTHGSASVNENGIIDTMWVALNSVPASNVVLSFISPDEAEVIVEYAKYSFNSGNWNIPRSFRIAGRNDNLVDGDVVTPLTIAVVDAESHNDYDALPDRIINVINADNDVAAYSVSKATASVSESGTGDSFTVALSAQPVSDVVFTISNSDEGEVLVDKNTLTFTTANWNNSQIVSLTGVDDFRIDGSQSSTITVSVDPDNSNDEFDALVDKTVIVTTFDDDVAGLVIVESDGNSTVDETGTSDSFTVALSAQPDSDVVINIANADTGELSVTPVSLTFTSANWDIAQTVSLSGEADLLADGDQTTFITLSVDAANSDNSFDAMTNVTVDVITIDDDVSPVVTASQVFSINEDAVNTASVGTVLATDGDAGTSFSGWTITSGNSDAIFGIDATSGEITIDNNTNLDFETTTSYTLSVTVSDGVNTSIAETVTIDINNINDNTPVITASQTFSVNEDAVNTASVGTVLVTDADAGTSYSSWTITSGNTDAIFAINPTSGVISIDDNSNLDFESATSYTLFVTVSDGVNTSSEETVSINVNDINDELPVVTASQSFSVNEDALNTASVGTVLVTDADAGTSYSSWTITSGNSDAIFAINPTSGVITIDNNTNLDFESATSYTLFVTVSDGVNTSSEETVSINVNDINDELPVVTASQSFSVNEDAANTINVGIVLATDADAGTTYSSWTITSGNTDAIFAINPTSGEITVADNSNLDFELATSYTLSVTVSDGVNTSSVETVSINVNDINDELPVVTASQSFSVNEDAANTTSVGIVLATDADAGTSLSSWTITGGNGDAFFAINPTSGVISIDDNSNLDFEMTSSYTLSVTVSDGANTSLVETVSINVNDINDELPVVTSSQSFSVNEHAANTTSVGIVLATDADAGTSLSSWTITGGDDDAIFAINPASGVITVEDNSNLDFERTTNFTLSVTVSDGLNVSSIETVNIAVNDLNDESPVITGSQIFSVKEDAVNTTSVGNILATDADAGTSFTNWTITGGNGDAIFAINPASGEITIADNSNLSFVSVEVYNLSINVSDGLNTSVTEVVTVNVINVNDNAPVITSSQKFSVSEDADNSITIGRVLATDADASTVYSNWTIINGNEDAIFRIDPSSGVISINNNAKLDFELIQTHTLGIKVSDGLNTSLVEDVEINVVNINDNIPVVTASQRFSVGEDAANSKSIGRVLAVDGDHGTSFSAWTISSGNDDAIFSINPASGEITIVDNTNLDFELSESYTLGISVSDGVKTSLVVDVLITITNANERPVAVAGENQIVADNSSVELNAWNSYDPDGDYLDFVWTAPEGIELSHVHSPTPIFTAPNVDISTDYIFTLIVNDGELYSEESFVTVTVDNVTGISDIGTDSYQLSLYPNPSKGAFTIELEQRPVDGVQVSLINLNAKLIYSQKVYEKKNFFNLSLASGMYILKVEQAGRISIKKLIVE